MPLVDAMIESVRKLVEVPADWPALVGPSVWKRGADIAFRSSGVPSVRHRHPHQQAIKLVWNEGPYFNVRLERDRAQTLIEDSLRTVELPAMARQRVAVEHSSMTPAYPLNLATLRSTVIGDCLGRAFGSAGAVVSPRYFLQDKCWHAGVINDRHQRWIHMKSDHAVGRAFAQAAFARRNTSQLQSLADAVALFPETEIRPYGEYERFPDAVTACFQGVSVTLERLGVLGQEVDRESRLVSVHEHARLMNLVETTAIPEGILKPFKTESYVVKSALYFSNLLADFDKVLCVASRRQEVHIEAAMYWATALSGGKPGRIESVLFSDVLMDGRTDSMSFRRFHSADQAIAQISSRYSLPRDSAAVVLRLLMLASPMRRPLKLGDDPSASVSGALGRILFKTAASGKLEFGRGEWPAGGLFILAAGHDAPIRVLESLEPHVVLTALSDLLFMLARYGPGPEWARPIVQQSVRRMCSILGVPVEFSNAREG